MRRGVFVIILGNIRDTLIPSAPFIGGIMNQDNKKKILILWYLLTEPFKIITLENILFYGEYIPKFVLHIIKYHKKYFISFLRTYKECLFMERYALQNKHLQNKFGDFEKYSHMYGGIDKALELDDYTFRKMAHVGEERDFQKEVNERTMPFKHTFEKPYLQPREEDILKEKQEELEGQGLGEVISIKVPEPEFGD